MAKKGILPTSYKIVLNSTANYQYISHPFFHSIRQFNHTRNHCRTLSLSRPGTTRSIMSLSEQRKMNGKRNSWISLVAQSEEGKEVPKRECLVLKSQSTCGGMARPGELHSVALQTAVGGISHADQVRNCFSQAKVKMDLETTQQVAARHFVKLAIFRQQRGTTRRSTDKEENYPIQANVGGNPKTTPQVAVRQAARLPIDRQQRGSSSIELSKQFDSGGSGKSCYSRTICAVFSVFVFLPSFFVFHCR